VIVVVNIDVQRLCIGIPDNRTAATAINHGITLTNSNSKPYSAYHRS
jgi:predicted nucleic acid-binding protein